MQHKPAPVVAKTNKLTAAQRQLIQNRRIGVGMGTPQRQNAGTSAIRPLYPQAPGTPIIVDKNGLVVNLAGDVIAALKPTRLPLRTAGKPKVTVNRDGTITATANGNTTTGRPALHTAGEGALPATQGMPARLPARPARPAANPARRPPARPPARRPATAPPAATDSADFALAQDRANQLISPIVKQITDALNQRISGEQAAITGYSGELARLFGLYSGTAGKAYDSAIASDSAVNDALANRLAGATTAAGNDLSARLAAINADPATAARIAAEVAAAGKGAGNAGFALGSADLTSMIGRKANVQEYGAKLPGLAGLYGLQDTRAAQARGTQDLASSLTSVQGNVPQLVSSLLSQIQTNRNQRDQLAYERQVLGIKAQTTKQSAAAAARKVDATLSKAYGVQMNSQGQPILGSDGKPIAYPSGGTPKQKVDLSLSKVYGVLMDNTGTPIVRGGRMIPLPNKTGSGLTPKQVLSYRGEAATIARNAFNGFTDAKGVVQPKLSLGGAMQEMRQSGIPPEIAKAELARWYNPRLRKRLQGK